MPHAYVYPDYVFLTIPSGPKPVAASRVAGALFGGGCPGVNPGGYDEITAFSASGYACVGVIVGSMVNVLLRWTLLTVSGRIPMRCPGVNPGGHDEITSFSASGYACMGVCVLGVGAAKTDETVGEGRDRRRILVWLFP